jgi:hypothetical protein
MDRIPPHKIDRSKTVEEIARLKDVADRARASRPLDTGRDILRGVTFGRGNVL